MQPGSTTTRSALSQYYAALSDAELEQLLRDPRIGAAAVDRINAELARRKGDAIRTECSNVITSATTHHPKSTNPRATMTRVEMRMADLLDMRKRTGEVQTWFFEAVKLRLADSTFYTVDFVVLLTTGKIEFIEVKGRHIFEDSRVKFKIAAAQYPFGVWRMLQWDQDEWKELYAFNR